MPLIRGKFIQSHTYKMNNCLYHKYGPDSKIILKTYSQGLVGCVIIYFSMNYQPILLKTILSSNL